MISRRNIIFTSFGSAAALFLCKELIILNNKKVKLIVAYSYPDGKKYDDFLVDRNLWSSQSEVRKIRNDYIETSNILSVNEIKNNQNCIAEIIFADTISANNFLLDISQKSTFNKNQMADLGYKLDVSISSV